MALPDQYSYGWVLLDLSAVTDLTAALTINVDLSFDGGQTWGSIGGWGLDLAVSGFTIQGGHVVDATGTPLRISGMSVRLTQRENANRQVRMQVALSQPCAVGMTVVIW